MTWSTLPQEVRDVAEQELTVKQLEAFKLECDQWGLARIARQLRVTKGAIVSRIEGAHLKLERAGVQQGASGNWYIESEEAA